MAEDRNSRQSVRERLYSTFDGEIIQIEARSAPAPFLQPAGPRLSLPPVPVIPGSCKLSDAIVRAKQRRDAEILEGLFEEDPGDELEAAGQVPDLETPEPVSPKTAGEPLVTAVSPGSFQRRGGSGNRIESDTDKENESILDKALLAIFDEGTALTRKYS